MNDTQVETGHAPVLLPVTDYAPRPAQGADRASAERWLREELHVAARESRAGRKRFVLHDGPPYANGNVHMGHAVNKVLKDMVVRTKRAMGMDATFSPGWDCHGLPIEWKVEEAFASEGVRKRDVPVVEFRAACRKYAQDWVDVQAEGFRRMGVVADWDRPYLTMSCEGDASVMGELHGLLLDGKLSRNLRPVLWSVPEATALADAEVNYREEKCPSLSVRFPVERASDPALEGASLVCWTTTPWSLPGNRAVACAPTGTYGVYEILEAEGARLKVGERLVMSVDCADAALSLAGCVGKRLAATVAGSNMAGTVCRHPLHGMGYVHEVPVLSTGFADPASGTGFVHVAPTLGPDDFFLGAANGLDLSEVVGADGAYVTGTPAFAGLSVVGSDGARGDADATLMRALDAAGATVSLKTTRHDAPYSWRSKAPLLYRATRQWFVPVDGKLRAEAVAALDDVAFLPEGSRTRLVSMLGTRPDWCVSRQRPWGVPLGLFVNRLTGEPLVDPDVLARTRRAFAEDGGDAWFIRPASWFLGPERDPEEWEKCDDVLDVWFESGCTHAWAHGLRGDPGGTVADLCLEGSDQHRGWFQSSLLESVATRGRAPYRALLTHGFVLDAKGRKMAKSEGNVVDPLDVVDKHGADALRLWVGTTDTSVDAKFSDQTMKNVSETLRRFRNALRFMLGNLASAPWTSVDVDAMEEPERWLLARLREVGRSVEAPSAALDFPRTLAALSRFCADDLSAYWFEARKDVLYCDAAGSSRRDGVCAAMSATFDSLSAWLAPFVPFAVEEAWSARYGDDAGSAQLLEWPDSRERLGDAALLARQRSARAVRDVVRAACEPRQKAGEFGSLSDVDATANVPPDMLRDVEGQDLAALVGTSGFSTHLCEGTMTVEIRRASGEKCDRCRRTLPEVRNGSCLRCEAVSRKD